MSDSSRGFTFVELVVTVGLMSIVVSAVAVLAVNTDRLARSQSRDIEVQQRGRVIAETLGRDLRLVGAGVDRGPMSGPLSQSFSPVFPRRVGRTRPDAVSAARPDAITLVHVPNTTWQTSLAQADAPSSGGIVLSPCAGGAMPCPSVRGATLALFEPPGRVDLLGVLGISGATTQVRVLGTSAGLFDAGSAVAEVVVRSYYFDAVQGQLRLYDGDASDQAVVDGVAALSFEYFGATDPPSWPRPPLGQQNCLYDVTGAWRGGVTLTALDDGLAPLPLAMFSDGPWCGAGGAAFDADLLRIRRIRVQVRLRATGAGEARPDYRVAFDISPKNLALSGASGGTDPSW
ncbi:MAG: prepilin-type N-terminal cleavage/methylation domain-containing protein [Vicinamibacterales bacterium]